MNWQERIGSIDVVVLIVVLGFALQMLRDYFYPVSTSPHPAVDDLPAIELAPFTDVSVFEHPERFGYRVYTQQHDRVVNANELQVDTGSEGRTRLLEHIVERQRQTADALAVRLSELGMTTATRAAILIDHSGSMNGKIGSEERSVQRTIVTEGSGAELAAGIAWVIAQAFEKCGVAVELLGFTTSDWQGGKSRHDWLTAGSPERPGRLNDLLHIVYKRADETQLAEVGGRLAAMLYPPLLKENVDGEAIAWARARLMSQPASDRLLIYISDGAPVDDSTLSENGPSYLERHLKHVVRDIVWRGDLRIVGIGIGHDIAQYVPQSVTFQSTESIASKVGAIARLLAIHDPSTEASQRSIV